MKIDRIYLGTTKQDDLSHLVKNSDASVPVVTSFNQAIWYKSEDFNRNNWSSNICFGQLIQPYYNSKISYVKNNGKVLLRISKIWTDNTDYIFYTHNILNYARSNYFVAIDNHLNIPIEIANEILDLLKENISFDYEWEDFPNYYILSLYFHDTSKNEMLYVLNICRRFWRFMLSVELMAVYNIYKSNQFNCSLFELLLICDGFIKWSMNDDLFLGETYYSIYGMYDFSEKRLDLTELHKENIYKPINFTFGKYLIKNPYNGLENEFILFHNNLKRLFNNNLSHNCVKKEFDSVKSRFDKYVQKTTYYLIRYINYFKDLNLL